MDKNEYRAALEKLGLSIVGAQRPFGIKRRQAQRYAAGEAPIPHLLERVLALLLRGRINLKDLEPQE